MNLIYTQFKLLYSNLSSNIAFYPSLITVLGVIFGFVMLYFEQAGISATLIKNTPSLVINDASTARTLISTFIGGIISIMVFSFSMVMLLLNQASTSYSPRILPGLISNKRNQIILGFYIAVILYNVLILISIDPTDDKYQLPGFSILIGIVLGIHVLPAFIYFINSISQSIQINNIISNIHHTASDRLDSLIDKKKKVLGKDTFSTKQHWEVLTTDTSGYVSNIAYDSMIKLGLELDTFFKLQVSKGSFILENTPLVASSKELTDEDKGKLRSCFGFSRVEIVSDNYLLGFKQLTEIALKAMSPGINDPGTAITCIDYLTQLFVLRMTKRDESFLIDTNGHAIVKVKIIPFGELLYYIYASLRQYCKADFIMMSRLLLSLKSLASAKATEDAYHKAILQQVHLIMIDAQKSISNPEDLNRLDILKQEITSQSSPYSE